MDLQLPQNVRQLATGETFNFICHPDLECFTDCCRDLELALTPYDVLRLKNTLHLKSSDFLDRYVIVEKGEQDIFPRLYLAMVDDGRASCPFVTAAGCTVYDSRPGACRTYPLGRAVSQRADNSRNELHVLLSEAHCRGHNATDAQRFTAASWTDDQELALYNEFNDLLLPLLQHEQVKQGRRLNSKQTDLFIMALYDLDVFRDFLLQPNCKSSAAPPERLRSMAESDTALLRFGIGWLHSALFGE
jgi:Fe-S-cluster containining protein